MPIDTNELIEAIDILANDRNIRVCVREAAIGAAIAGACAFLGALLGGPRGLAVGAATGGIAASILANENFISVGAAVRVMESPQRRRLIRNVENAVEGFGYTDVVTLLPFLLSNRNIQDTVMNVVVNFLRNEIGLNITQ